MVLNGFPNVNRMVGGVNRHFFPQTGGCSEGLGAFRFFFKQCMTGEKPTVIL